MTRYKTRQFAPVRISDAMPYQEFSRYKSETKKIMGDNDLTGELQQSILNELEETAERAVALERAAEEEVGNEFRQVKICAIRGALSAGWQWWSGNCDLVGYCAAERPISGAPEKTRSGMSLYWYAWYARGRPHDCGATRSGGS